MSPALADGPLHRAGQPGAGTAMVKRHSGTPRSWLLSSSGQVSVTALPPGLDQFRCPRQCQGLTGRLDRDGNLVQLSCCPGACFSSTEVGVVQLQDRLGQSRRERTRYVVPIGQRSGRHIQPPGFRAAACTVLTSVTATRARASAAWCAADTTAVNAAVPGCEGGWAPARAAVGAGGCPLRVVPDKPAHPEQEIARLAHRWRRQQPLLGDDRVPHQVNPLPGLPACRSWHQLRHGAALASPASR